MNTAIRKTSPGSVPPQIYRLTNTVQHYDWGSHTDIRELLNTPESGKPEAELWLGAHPSAPSLAAPWSDSILPNSDSELHDGSHVILREVAESRANVGPIALDRLIQQMPVEMLGNRVLDKFGPKLPYLLKVLAADRALSLQVHPASHLARAGFNRENREKVPITAPHRNFKDGNHKPEMIIAVTEFHALAGLRPPRVVLRMIEGLSGQLFDLIRDAIAHNPNHDGIKSALTNLLAQRNSELLHPHLAEAINSIKSRVMAGSQYQVADQTALDLAAEYPGDVGALSSYLLNRVTLLPGEALFMGDGEVHAYLKGLGIEIMANSDNVLRAGLTSKHVDVNALIECMSFHPKMPHRPDQYEIGEISRSYSYRPPVEEFALTMFDLHDGEPLPIQAGGPRIVLVLEGEVFFSYGGAAGIVTDAPVNTSTGRVMTRPTSVISGLPPTTVALTRGVSVFVPDVIGPAELSGSGQVVCAWVP